MLAGAVVSSGGAVVSPGGAVVSPPGGAVVSPPGGAVVAVTSPQMARFPATQLLLGVSKSIPEKLVIKINSLFNP